MLLLMQQEHLIELGDAVNGKSCASRAAVRAAVELSVAWVAIITAVSGFA
jgi:hypothetical protein